MSANATGARMQERLRSPGGDRFWAFLAVVVCAGVFLAGVGTGNSIAARADGRAEQANKNALAALSEVAALREEQKKQAERFALYNSRAAFQSYVKQHAAEDAARTQAYQNAMQKTELKIIAEIRGQRGR